MFYNQPIEPNEEEEMSVSEPDYLPIYKKSLLSHEVYEQEYNYGDNPPDWCNPKK